MTSVITLFIFIRLSIFQSLTIKVNDKAYTLKLVLLIEIELYN